MANEPCDFRDLIDKWGGVPAFQAEMGLNYVTAQKMYQRNSIAPKYWSQLIEHAAVHGIDLDAGVLLQLRDRSRNG